MPKPPDTNARHAAGEMPPDPFAEAEPMPAPGLPPKLSELIEPAFARMRARQAGTEKPIPVPWPTLAAPLGGGLWPGLHVLVGNTATGKTQWCLQVALQAGEAGTPVLYVALEAGDVEFVARCLGLVAGTYWSPLYHGRHERLETPDHDTQRPRSRRSRYTSSSPRRMGGTPTRTHRTPCRRSARRIPNRPPATPPCS